ncbi:hypothetical protein LEP1GSC161_2707 [Leptospira santarosai str. CBC1416]|uniref:Uncharacterized protein n=2 Tax=Leptospira santarosai TaxID=28183 RepID=M6UUB5_9LEPT|nr:hypothetical protein LEP1GSC163_4268 [Leptospira santarosai str. CBC379]EMO33195.1 hypothetical protein LEP1GSC175_1964 [Leptospira santarosai str. HAI821]EMO44599.1 hypothetical protein LEP1GSC187_0073 [Leptospira santarosai str. ZUN179]EMO58593.1 hypothetical protein LEP1GSC161_2707 [Leptospira santarosai str. CBC1416]
MVSLKFSFYEEYDCKSDSCEFVTMRDCFFASKNEFDIFLQGHMRFVRTFMSWKIKRSFLEPFLCSNLKFGTVKNVGNLSKTICNREVEKVL